MSYLAISTFSTAPYTEHMRLEPWGKHDQALFPRILLLNKEQAVLSRVAGSCGGKAEKSKKIMLVWRQNLINVGRIYRKTTSFDKTIFYTSYPNLLIFLHRYKFMPYLWHFSQCRKCKMLLLEKSIIWKRKRDRSACYVQCNLCVATLASATREKKKEIALSQFPIYIFI